MDINLFIITALTIVVLFFLYLYLSNEKKNKSERIKDLNELKQLLSSLQTKIQETSNQHGQKFEALEKAVRTAQDQANSKINSGFELLQSENLNIQKDVKDKISDVKTSFKEYSQKLQDTISKYSEDTHQSKIEANR